VPIPGEAFGGDSFGPLKPAVYETIAAFAALKTPVRSNATVVSIRGWRSNRVAMARMGTS
jgi:hypothetical protein